MTNCVVPKKTAAFATRRTLLDMTLTTGSDTVTPVSLLLALVADPDGVGTQVLSQLGATPEKVREAVDRLTPPS